MHLLLLFRPAEYEEFSQEYYTDRYSVVPYSD